MARRRRLLFASIVLIATVECLWFLFSASVMWSIRGMGLGPPEVAINTRTALGDFAWTVLNVSGLLAFVTRRRGVVVWLFVGVQVFDIADTLWAGLVSASDGFWDTASFHWALMVVPIAILVLVIAWRRTFNHVKLESRARQGGEG